MNFFDLVNISERDIELVNPSSEAKVVRLGELLGLQPGRRVIDFGCGYAQPLLLWAEHFGIEGLGIDIRPHACERARQKIADRGLSDRLEIICANAAEYASQARAFDIATCLGATFIWDGFAPAVQAMKATIKDDGRLGLGEVYWSQETVPPSIADSHADVYWETDLLRWSREAGFIPTGVVRSDQADWDRYESGNWRGLLRWLADHPDHPDRRQVQDHLDTTQSEYFEYGRQYFGWALYALERSPKNSG